MFTVLWEKKALDDLKLLDRAESRRIFEKVNQHLAVSPKESGKPLKAHLKGFYRYRVGKYRVIYMIKDFEVLVVVLRVGKRDKVYQS